MDWDEFIINVYCGADSVHDLWRVVTCSVLVELADCHLRPIINTLTRKLDKIVWTPKIRPRIEGIMSRKV